MKRNSLLMGAVFLLLGLCTSSALADSPSLQDLQVNVNGTSVEAGSDATFAADLAALGVNLSSYNTSTGLGTITFTTTTAGAGYFNTWFDEAVSTPFYNEFGTANGTASAGQSWEIGDSYNSTIFNDAANGTLTNTNLLPEGASNYLNTCSGACNGDASTALGYSYNVAAGDEEIITVTVSTTAPSSGFYLDQTHPADDNNPTALNVYFSLTAEEIPQGTTSVPEGGTPLLYLLLAAASIGGALFFAARKQQAQFRDILHQSDARPPMYGGPGAGLFRMRRPFQFKAASVLAGLFAVVAVTVSAGAQSVNTVPLDPKNPAAPHTAYPGANIVLGAIFKGASAVDSYTYSWNFGDGSAATTPAALTNPNDISARHIYAGTTVGKTWTAVVTVNDTTTSAQYTGNYLVIWENNTLQSRVNVAIDLGLWYLHQTMYHPSAGVGYWSGGCASGYSGYACSGYGSLDASNVQAFEVNGHLATGPASDPYTSDVQEGLNQMFTNLSPASVQPKTYTFNTATYNYGCSDGTAPIAGTGACDGTATKVFYNAGGNTCATVAQCTFTFDGNSNGLAIFAQQQGYSWGYEDGQYADAIVASANPGGVAGTGSVSGEKYSDIVQDIADAASYCQYPNDLYDVETGYNRGNYAEEGGGWWYNCQTGGDNSVSQWASIGLIGAQRGFGISIPTIVTDANNMWVTASQDVQGPLPQPNDPYYNSYDTSYGAFGYNGSLYYSNAWGPFAVTPSGMVQMSMDGIGRTKNVAFGDATTDPDQRFNNAETFYADNFCNSTNSGSYTSPYYTPRNYTYGLFSFTKAMLLHNPNGALSPIQYLRTQTPGVFTTNTSIPANSIDWYAALSPANGGTDPCDGVAQTIVGRQNAAGYWYGDNYSGAQYPYETAWSIIMLQRTVFITCVNNLGGAGTASGTSPARIDLTWTGIPNVTGYDVLRSTTSGGPYTEVGTTTTTAYSDRTGLSNGNTYYYVLQPVNATGAVCQSNQTTITVPKARR
jgi:hypothetical protein